MPTVKHLSFAGITLPLSPSFLEDVWLKVVHDEYSAKFIDLWSFDQGNDKNLPTPNLPRVPAFSLDKLTWPTGASTPATFHTIVETNRLNQITAASAPSGYNTPKPLYFFDGRVGKTITAQMYTLPARPLNHLGKEFSDLHLLTLTDVRFYWHFARFAFENTFPALSPWIDLYARIATALNTTITVEAIPSAYGVSGGRWYYPYQVSASALLDAVATQVGQRVVVGLDGSVKTVNWQTAQAASLNYSNTTNGRLISGWLIQKADIANYVPSSVQVVFNDYTTTPPNPYPFIINKTLPSLSIADYGTATGIPNYHMSLFSDIDYTGGNLTEATAFATQAATDWYGWRLVDTDLVYAGIEPWVPTGWEDEIEWTLKLIEQNPALPTTEGDDPYCKTQIRRGPWTDIQSLSLPSILGSVYAYEDECLNGYLVQYRRTVYIDNNLEKTDREFVKSYGIPCGNASGSSPTASGSGVKPTTLNLNVVTNVCIDSSGGLILQKQNITVLAVGAVSSALCTTAKGIIDCCPTVTPNPRLVCCPDNIAAAAIIFAIDGPIGPGCTEVTAAGIANQVSVDGLQYSGSLLGTASLDFSLYCDEGIGYRATGTIISKSLAGGGVLFYDVEMNTDPVTGLLFGEIGIPGCGIATIAATQPCGQASGSGDSGSGTGSNNPSCICCPPSVTNPAVAQLIGCGFTSAVQELARDITSGAFISTSFDFAGSTGTLEVGCSISIVHGRAVWVATVVVGSYVGGGNMTQNGTTLTVTINFNPGSGPCTAILTVELPLGCYEVCP